MRRVVLSCLLIAWVMVVVSPGLRAQEPGSGTGSAANSDAQPVLSTNRGQFRALLVGVNDYERLNDLRFCEEDVRALRDQLVRMGFQRDAIKCLTTSDPDPALRPSFRNITERLDALFAGLDEQSVLVIALAGHGGSFEFRGPSGEDAKASFYCPQDGRLYDPRGTMISVKSIYDRLERCPARFKMLLVDACRDRRIAPPGARTAIDEARTMAGFARSLSDGVLPKGTLALVSCTSGEQSYEDPTLKHGIFMYYLLEGLSGRADAVYRGNRDEMVSYRELKDYVYRKTSDHAWRKWDQPQTPDFRANWELPDFALARSLTRRLFDGKSLRGWRADKNPHLWSVRSGALVGQAGPSHLFFGEQFADFWLTARVKVNAQGNGGLFIRAKEQAYAPDGYEVQIAGSTADGGWSPNTGSLYRIKNVDHNAIRDDTWFQLDVSAIRNHITVRIDDRTVLDFVDRENRYSRGHIALQTWDPATRIAFRDLAIQTLDEQAEEGLNGGSSGSR